MNRSYHFIAQPGSFNCPFNKFMKSKFSLAFCLILALAIQEVAQSTGKMSSTESTAAPETMSPPVTLAAPHLLQLSLSSPQLMWQQLNFQTLPSPRIGSALTLNPVNQVALLFGGSDPLHGMLNDLWLTDGRAWLQFKTLHAPEARSGASLVYDEARQEAVLFGGAASNSTLFGDTWIFNGIDWIQQQPLVSPPPRTIASMAYDADRNLTILFGGLADTGGKYWDALGDMWIWDGATWIEQHPLHHPAGRQSFGMAYDEGRQQVILFGGQTSVEVNPSETWAWDGQDWTKLLTFQTPPSEMAVGAQLVYLPDLQTVSLFNDFRQKIINPDYTATFIERTEVWALNSRYLVFSPLITRR
jgi:Galactose oxidase, central domain